MEIHVKTDEILIQEAFDRLLSDYKQLRQNADVELVEKAFLFANNAHKGVKRRSGEPYILHPIKVAHIALSEIGLGTTSICCALLHDVVEDTDYTAEDIANIFGEKIAKIVVGLTKISGGFFGTRDSEQAENFRNLLLTISEDVRVILIKMADRLHNMRTLSSMPPAKQHKITGETQYIYAPIAYQLGLFKIKTELENLSFKYEYPDICNQLTEKLHAGEPEREIVYHKFLAPIQEKISTMGYNCEFKKRVKTVYSIWHKMQTKHIPFDEIFDILAVRIIFEPKEGMSEQEQCWMIYSAVTKFYRTHPERIRDWVSMPKANGYEALHVTVMGPHGYWIEVQIRSTRMHEIAERGIAAHWKYKGGGKGNVSQVDDWDWIEKVKSVLENPDPNALEFLDTFKMNLYDTELFVFTPKGDLKTIQQGATALDFAFMLHTDLGLRSIGAKVNKKLVPLSYVLNSGDQIEILTSKTQKAQAEWLNFVTTAKAKSHLKRIFKEDTKTISAKGQQLVEEYVNSIGLSVDASILHKLMNYYDVQFKQELYKKLGREEINLRELDEKMFAPSDKKKLARFWTFNFGKKSSGEQNTNPQKQSVDRKITIKLTDENPYGLYKIAECCHPIPGDEVLGYVDSDANDNETIVLHKRECPVASRLKTSAGERIVAAEWKTKKKLLFPVKIELSGIDAVGVLSDITNVISHDNASNIRKIHIETKDGIFEGYIELYVYDAKHIDTICSKIRKIEMITSVKRLTE